MKTMMMEDGIWWKVGEQEKDESVAKGRRGGTRKEKVTM